MTKKEKKALAYRLESEVYYYYLGIARNVAYYELGITKAQAQEDCSMTSGRLQGAMALIGELLGDGDMEIAEAAEVLGVDLATIKERALEAVEAMKTRSKFNGGERID
jgi:hypothetical protein